LTSILIGSVTQKAYLHDGNEQNDGEEDKSHRRSSPHARKLEGCVIHIKHDSHRAVRRRSSSGGKDKVKHLQRPDCVGDDHEQHNRSQQRQRDIAKLLKFASAIDLGSVVVVLWNALQAGQKDHNIVTNVLINRDEDQGGQGLTRPAQEWLARQAEHRDNVVDNPIVAVKNDGEHHGQREGGGNHRRKVKDAPQGAPPNAAVQQKGEAQTQYGISPDTPDSKQKRIAQGP